MKWLHVTLVFFLVGILAFSLSNDAFGENQRLTVSAGDSETLTFYLNSGDKIRYSISVAGGSNDDVDIIIKNPNGGIINQGRIYENYNNQFTATSSGSYSFEFDNDFSFVSKKGISFDYNIIKKPVFSGSSATSAGSVMGAEIIWFILMILIIIIPIAIWKKRKKNKAIKENQNFTSDHTNSSTENIQITKQNDDSTRILRERLAKGEITKDEYNDLKGEFE